MFGKKILLQKQKKLFDLKVIFVKINSKHVLITYKRISTFFICRTIMNIVSYTFETSTGPLNIQ